jgi:hypothetical protein
VDLVFVSYALFALLQMGHPIPTGILNMCWQGLLNSFGVDLDTGLTRPLQIADILLET